MMLILIGHLQGAEYVNNLQSQMKELEEELERLKATKCVPS